MSEDQSVVLLQRAREDEYAARALLPLDGVADAIVGFHCQQAVEKALKAILLGERDEVPYTHDVDGLLEECRARGLDVPQELRGAERLTLYAVQMRYDANPGGSLDREQALRWADVAVEWASGLERARDPKDPWRSRSEPDRADR